MRKEKLVLQAGHVGVDEGHSLLEIKALLYFRTPPIVIDDSLKKAAESFAVALTLAGYESAIAPK